ncbi:hypothetical protein FIBSPDRAFT_987461 [Athelia psychrophila]|uniref:Uncharacterized protein n=1 Tax=Athelia psychrophila TaxID=1759441 RepID=A0A166AK37_9AGAM|nr:hypothetical protein FIBSPDRAFT_987461 [Fibularhizoctonia sp. CBS 109695]
MNLLSIMFLPTMVFLSVLAILPRFPVVRDIFILASPFICLVALPVIRPILNPVVTGSYVLLKITFPTIVFFPVLATLLPFLPALDMVFLATPFTLIGQLIFLVALPVIAPILNAVVFGSHLLFLIYLANPMKLGCLIIIVGGLTSFTRLGMPIQYAIVAWLLAMAYAANVVADVIFNNSTPVRFIFEAVKHAQLVMHGKLFGPQAGAGIQRGKRDDAIANAS